MALARQREGRPMALGSLRRLTAEAGPMATEDGLRRASTS